MSRIPSVFTPAEKWPGCKVFHSTPSSKYRGQEWVELNLAPPLQMPLLQRQECLFICHPCSDNALIRLQRLPYKSFLIHLSSVIPPSDGITCDIKYHKMNHKKKPNSCIFSCWVVQILNFILSLPFPDATPRGHDAQYSALPSAESKNAGRCTTTPPYTFIVQCLIRHKNSFSISFICLPLLYSPLPHWSIR